MVLFAPEYEGGMTRRLEVITASIMGSLSARPLSRRCLPRNKLRGERIFSTEFVCSANRVLSYWSMSNRTSTVTLRAAVRLSL
jgi:hypothetical protein